MRISVHPVDVSATGSWSFMNGKLTWCHENGAMTSTYDPFPAYPHDLETARRTAAVLEERCPPLWDVQVHSMDREEIGRTNGFSVLHQPYHASSDPAPRTGLIVMSGKRIPPHPAVTRYLVAHEYGHNVAWMIAHARNNRHPTGQEWLAEYARMRGLPEDRLDIGDGGTWHTAVGEVFACDFRIVVGQVEPEYWPHPTVAHPLQAPAVADWWLAATAELDAARQGAA